MGDRTYAQVTIRKEYYYLIKDKDGSDFYCSDIQDNGDTVDMIDYEANYGEMDDVTSVLQSLDIPYDIHWEAGGDYGAGTVYCRFVDGQCTHKEIYDENDGVVSLHLLEEWIGKVRDLQHLVSNIEVYKKENFEIPQGRDVAKIPLRELTEEESALIMKHKLEE